MKPEISNEQKQYLLEIQRRKYWILTAQVSLLLILLFLWEWAVDSGYLNGFIFSSPSRMIQCFYRLQYFYPHWHNHGGDSREFFSDYVPYSWYRHASLVVSHSGRYSRTVSCCLKQSSEIRSGTNFNCVAWQ